jgi:chemotaxis protein histidine kinase CheA
MSSIIKQAVAASIVARADGAKEGEESKLDAVMGKLDAVGKRLDEAADERKADRARLDETCKRMDSYDDERKADKTRKDAEEKAKADAEEKAKADAARKDAEEKEKDEKERADKARADAEEKARADAAAASATGKGTDDVRARLEALEKGLSTEDLGRFSAVQVRAEPVYQAFGDSQGAPRWMHGEGLAEYRRRLLGKLKVHSRDWKDVDLTKIHDDQAFGVAETRIYADAMDAALHPTDLAPNVLRTISKRDDSGRTIHRFVGADDAAWSQFTFFPTQIRAGRIKTQAQRD